MANNNAFATTGLDTFAIGSVRLFQVQPWKNGVPWDLSLGTANLILADPDGNLTTLPANITSGGASVSWQVVGPAGQWTRAWDMSDASGQREVSLPIGFGVISSPY